MNRFSISSRFVIVCIVTATVAANTCAMTKPRVQTATVKITERGYEPDIVKVRRGVRTRITFVRTTDATCATEVVFPELGIKRELPLNQPVVITFTPRKKGEFTFTCGMKMMRGRLIVQ
jgi:plastocyanin domain-containing protein